MIETMGIFEAKVHWSAVLEKVARGATIILTKRGKPIARLVPEAVLPGQSRIDAATELLRLREQNTLGGISWRELRDGGRKY